MNDASIKLGLDSEGINRGLTNVEKRFDGLGGKIKAVGAAVGVSFGAGAIIAAGKSLLDYASKIQDASDTLDLSTDSYQGFIAAVRTGGATAEDFEKAYGKLIQKAESARRGSAEDVEIFERLGVTWKDLSTLGTDQIFLKIAESVRTSKNATASYSDVVEVMGKTGRKLVPTFKEMGAGIQDFGDQTEKVSAAQIREMDELQDRWETGWNNMKNKAIKALFEVKDALDNTRKSAAVLAGAEDVVLQHGVDANEKRNLALFGPGGAPSKDPEVARTMAAAKKEGEAAVAKPAAAAVPAAAKSQVSTAKAVAKALEPDPFTKEKNEALLLIDHQRLETMRAMMTPAERLASLESERTANAKRLVAIDQSNLQGKKDHLALTLKQAELENEITRQKDAQKKAQEDRSKATIGELAAHAHNADGAKARQVERLEKRAERERVRGHSDRAGKLQSRADQIKDGISSLKSTEKNQIGTITAATIEVTNFKAKLVNGAGDKGS